MGDETQDLYQLIGQEVSRIARGATGRVVNQVEAEDGVMSTAVYFVRGDRVVFKHASGELVDLLERLWDQANADDLGKEWREMRFIIENGRFRVEFDYEGSMFDRAPDVKQREFVKKYFDVSEWDYSDPDPGN